MYRQFFNEIGRTIEMFEGSRDPNWEKAFAKDIISRYKRYEFKEIEMLDHMEQEAKKIKLLLEGGVDDD